MFKPSIYETIMENDECWFVGDDGCAMIVSDASLMDC
jgi:prophage antirepressor-like protein